MIATFGMGVLTAVVPVINMEIYIASIAATVGDLNLWWVATVAGVGQAVGKIPWYEVSRSSMQWGFVRRRMEKPDWKRRYDKVHQQTHDKPWLVAVLIFSSALIALPPLAITAVLAGQLRFSRVLFHAMIILGRTLQFAALLGGIAWLTHL